jgi:outer membrane protein assembly factor BamA
MHNTKMKLLLNLLLLAVAIALTPPHSSSRGGPASYHWHNHNEEEEYLYPNNLLDLDNGACMMNNDSPLFLTLSSSTASTIRGGSSNSKNGKKNPVLAGSRSSIATTKEYWSNAFSKATAAITKPFRNLGKQKPTFLQSKEERRQNELIAQLRTTPITTVKIVGNSTVVPPEVVQIAAKRAGLLGKPLQTQSVQQLAQSLKQWYDRQGYILHSMTGATLQVETQTAELAVQEPKSSSPPVALVYCKEMVIDPADGSLLTIRQYRDKMASDLFNSLADTDSNTHFGRRRRPKFDRSAVNTTFIPTDVGGRTDPRRMASVLGLEAGKPFMWQPHRWSVVSRKLFKKALRATPQRMPDGTVQLQLVVQEAPARHLEYGISKSLYTDSWEGEVDFQHQNLLGGGESLGVTVRRGTHDAEPSVRIELENDHFGLLPRGYNVQVFSDYIGEHLEDENGSGTTTASASSSSDEKPSASVLSTKAEDYDHDELLDRKGTSISIRSPFASSFPLAKTASACLERTSTKGGRHESVGSTTMNLGPVARELPLDARTSIFGKVTTGTRVGESKLSDADNDSRSLLPFCSLQATTRQLFPLTGGGRKNRPVILALSHSATTSTRHLPRHEANAQGVACKIRGYHGGSTSERVANSVVGTTELRIPVSVAGNEASVVLFGDWCLSQAPASPGASTRSTSFKRRSSVGVGLRKNFQGFPLKYDVSYTQDHKIGAFFGLGPDFQAE